MFENEIGAGSNCLRSNLYTSSTQTIKLRPRCFYCVFANGTWPGSQNAAAL